MARITAADLRSQDSGEAPGVIEALAPLATGKNEDGTDFFLPVSIGAAATYATVTTAAATALNDACTVPVAGLGTVAFELRPSAAVTGTITFEASYDGGTTWSVILGSRQDSISAASSIAWAASSTPYQFQIGVPQLATSIRARVSAAITGGTLRLMGQASAQALAPVVAVGGSVSLASSTNRIGLTAQGAIWFSETISATLAAAASANGTTRDLFVSTSGSPASSSGAYAAEFRAFSTADQGHLLGIDVSDDGTTWDRQIEVTATSKATRFTAYADIKPVARYARAQVYNNSGSAFTYARLRSASVA